MPGGRRKREVLMKIVVCFMWFLPGAVCKDNAPGQMQGQSLKRRFKEGKKIED